jgi:hypothetical protein
MPIEKPTEKRFIFHGSGVAFAARVRRPDDKFIKAAAPSHLPVTGGLSEGKVEGPDIDEYFYKDVITFKRAHSRAQGDFSDSRAAVQFTRGNYGQNNLPANTAVEARLEGLRIDFEADSQERTPRRIFQAQTLHIHAESTTNRRDPVSFRSLTAVFDGITLTTVTDGTSGAVELKVHTATEVFSDNDTKAKLLETYAKDPEFRRKYASCFHPIGATVPGLLGSLLHKAEYPKPFRGPIVATFVTELEWVGGVAPVGTEILNNRLTVAGLGRIYFGEIVVEENSRRTTIIRFELGSPSGIDASGPDIVTNGSDTENN